MSMSHDQKGNEALEEILEPIGDDPLITEFLHLLSTLPPPDHVTLTNRMQFGGVVKRLKDMWDDIRYRREIESNIFAPTAAIKLFRQVNEVFPNH